MDSFLHLEEYQPGITPLGHWRIKCVYISQLILQNANTKLRSKYLFGSMANYSLFTKMINYNKWHQLSLYRLKLYPKTLLHNTSMQHNKKDVNMRFNQLQVENNQKKKWHLCWTCKDLFPWSQLTSKDLTFVRILGDHTTFFHFQNCAVKFSNLSKSFKVTPLAKGTGRI